MRLAPEAVEAEVLTWTAEQRVDLAEKLIASVEDFASEEIRRAWETELAQRLADIREDRAEGIPADQVIADARLRLHEARRVSVHP